MVLTSLLLVIPVTDAAAQTISVSPDAGPTGTTVTVSGSGFTSGFPPCRIEFEITPGEPGSRVQVSSCTVNDNGVFSETFDVPADAEPGARF